MILVQVTNVAKTAESKLHDNLGKLQVTQSFFPFVFVFFNTGLKLKHCFWNVMDE